MIFLWPVAFTLSFLNITEPHSTTKSAFIKLLTRMFLSFWMYLFFFYCTVIQFFFIQGLHIHNKQKNNLFFIEILRVLYSSFSAKYY